MIKQILLGLFLLLSVTALPQGIKERGIDGKISSIEAKCEQGNTEACEKLYFYYLNRKQYDTEGHLIVKYVKKLSDLKRPKYVFMWGISTCEGSYGTIDIPQDFAKGMSMIKEAADMDYPPAQMMIADFFSITDESRGLRRAVYYLNCACESEYEPACEVLIALGASSTRIYDKSLRDKMWEAIDDSGDKFLRKGRYEELRDKLRKEKFINN